MENDIVQCIAKEPILSDLLSGLREMPYEIYLQKNPSIVYILCDFRVHSKFTLIEYNVALHVSYTLNEKSVALHLP
jgi:hypothetical protein